MLLEGKVVESLLEKLTKMNSILRNFQKDGFELVEPTKQVKIANSVLSWYSSFVFGVLVLGFAISLFRSIEFSWEFLIGSMIFLFSIALILHIWNYFYLRNRANCKKCGSKLELTEGDWVEFDTQTRRNVVFSCRECKKYFYTVEEQSNSDSGGD